MTRSSMRFILLFMVMLTSWLSAAPAHAAVELSYFEVVQGSVPPELLVKWGTETERDTVEFLLKRGEIANPAQSVLVHRTQARGSTVDGADYQFTDTNVTGGRVYYYWLIELTGSGQEKQIGSTQATAGGTPTPTSTALPATAIPTGQPPTATPTGQPPTATPTVQPPTATPTAQPTATTQASSNNAPEPAATLTPPPAPTTGAQSNLPTRQPPVVATNPPAAPTTGANPTLGDVASQPTAPASGDAQPIQTTDAPATDASTPQARERSQNQDAAVQDPATSAPAGDQSNTTATDQAGGAPAGEATATPQMLAEAPAAPQAQLLRPTATPRPSDSSDEGDNTSSLLMVIGGGSLCGAALLILVVVFVLRRH